MAEASTESTHAFQYDSPFIYYFLKNLLADGMIAFIGVILLCQLVILFLQLLNIPMGLGSFPKLKKLPTNSRLRNKIGYSGYWKVMLLLQILLPFLTSGSATPLSTQGSPRLRHGTGG